MPAKKSRLGWLGPAIVILGVAVAGLGVWYMIHARPEAGAVIDTIKVENGGEIVVRSEVNGDNDFVEARLNGETKWQAMVPHYAGKTGVSGIAWSPSSITVRVVRDDRAELFALSADDGHKLGGIKLAPDHGPIAKDAPGPITVTDHIRSYEIVSGADWHQLVGVDLRSGRGLWKVELGSTPIHDAGMDPGGEVWILQGTERRKFFVFNGMEDRRLPQ
jgi:outer membrane protein assembly factor BamB